MGKFLFYFGFVLNCILINFSFAQTNSSLGSKDSLHLKFPFNDYFQSPFQQRKTSFSLGLPSNIQREIIYDPISKQYIIQEKIGQKLFRPPSVYDADEFRKLQYKKLEKAYWSELSTRRLDENRLKKYFSTIEIQNPTFEKIFGGNRIDIIPKGSVEVGLLAKRNVNQNPMVDERYRKMWGLDFDQNINLSLTGKIGERGELFANFNTQAEFDFENQIRFNYRGKEDDILQSLEIGSVNMPLPTTFIQGAESLFGIKAQFQLGKLNITGIASQQRSKKHDIYITNGNQEHEVNLEMSRYDANQHFFLGQYFREQYNTTLALTPLVNSPINITEIEVWISNQNNSNDKSRDILAFLDLGEYVPYNTLITGTPSNKLPSTGIPNQTQPQQSNNLLTLVGEQARLSNSNFTQSLFASAGGPDNYAKINAARRLEEGRDYTINRKLGYISLNMALEQDQILAVAYRYFANGKEYQVGELSTDIPQDATQPKVLYTKLLKNAVLKTNLPTWDLMMKNIYSLHASNISEQNIQFQIYRTENSTNAETPSIFEGRNSANKSWLQLTQLDRLTQNFASGADGYFDFIPDITINNQKGKLIFPVVEPFGKDLANWFATDEGYLVEKYTYPELYAMTQNDAEQKFPEKNRYRLKGKYTSSSSSSYQLGVMQIRPGTVQVQSNGILLQEGIDYSIDYSSGELQILNQGILLANQTIKVSIEDENILGYQQKTLFGGRLDYTVNQNLLLGATLMKLSERPYSEKVNIGFEPISNTMIGADLTYSKTSKWLTRWMNRLPFLHVYEDSQISFYGEVAHFKPGVARAILTENGQNGTTYIDDFENTFSYIDIKNQLGWQISGTPQLFPEASLSNDLAYGYNRAHLAFYNIDPVFYQNSNLNPGVHQQYLIDHRTRKVTEKEVFPFKEIKTGEDAFLPTLDLAFYPMLRGTYNYSTNNIAPDGKLLNPTRRWGGIFRRMEQTDFESENIEFLEMWIMDPTLTNPNKAGGDIYINLGNISEDILKDGRKSLENGLPLDDLAAQLDQTVWGNVVKTNPIAQAFENSESSRLRQDVGLDGLSNNDERIFHQSFLNQLRPFLRPEAFAEIEADPSSDDYTFFRGNHFDSHVGILDRYKKYNGTEGNSKTREQSLQAYGVETSASTLFPDGEDINRDQTMNEIEEYYQYKLSLRPEDMVIGKNFIVDEQTSKVRVLNKNMDVKWYKIRIPLSDYESSYGNIQDFKSVRFVRLFMTNFADTSIVRFAKMQFVKGQWRKYNAANLANKVIADHEMGTVQADHSTFQVANINIEENGKREPIPYIVPPGINRQIDYTNNNLDIQLNEQALSLQVKNLRDGYGRATFKTGSYDFRPYGRIQMYVHAEGETLHNGDFRAFLRIGSDDQYNYYEYDMPLDITSHGSVTAESIWPEQNRMDIAIKLFQEAKLARDQAMLSGQPWPMDIPFEYSDGNRRIRILGAPDLSKIRFLMIGVRNPLRGSATSNAIDDGRELEGEFWFNELRLTDFDTKGGWAATARLQLKLADFANVAITGTKTTIGFGQLGQSISERNRSENTFFDITSNAELGKLFHPDYRLSIPFYFNYSNQIATPEYNPLQPDIKLNAALATLHQNRQDSLLRLVQDYTMRKNFSFTNVRKMLGKSDKILKPWHLENIGLTYAFSSYQHRDINITNSTRQNHRAIFDYTYSQPNLLFKEPFRNSKTNLKWLKDFNFNLMPSLLNFRMEVNRIYAENTFRDNANDNILPTYYNKNFNMTRIYGISWDLTKSLRLDFNATNYVIIDEPNGRIDGARRDTLWNNFWKLGRTTDYNHMMNVTYTLPIHKLPYLDWVNILTRYGTQFNWQSEPLITLQHPTMNLGNSIQNNRTIQINPTLNFNTFYSKFRFLRENTRRDAKGLIPALVQLMTSIRNFNGAYTRMEGMYLPGYVPSTNTLGYSFDANAPGIGFLFGSQEDILFKASQKGWISTDTLQNKLFTKTYAENLSAVINIEPIKGMRIDLTTTRIDNFNYSTSWRMHDRLQIEKVNPYRTGNYTVSQANIRQVFENSDQLFQKFEQAKQIISHQLAENNIHSSGQNAQFFADGYDKNQQDVVINAFLQIYLGKDIHTGKSNNKPNFPIPNWRLSYNRLTQILGLDAIFSSFHIHHAYQSQYIITAYNSSALYASENEMVFSRDANNNFLPKYHYQQVSLIDRFIPLIGIDTRLHNGLTLTGEFRKSKDISLNLRNDQLAVLDEKSWILGIGYRKTNTNFPLGWLAHKKWKNDINFKVDFAMNDRKSSVYRSGLNYAEIAGGNKSLTINPTLDYTINRLYNIRLYYNSNVVRPYTSVSYMTAYNYFGVNFRILFQ